MDVDPTVGAFSVITNLRMDLFEALLLELESVTVSREAEYLRGLSLLTTAQTAGHCGSAVSRRYLAVRKCVICENFVISLNVCSARHIFRFARYK